MERMHYASDASGPEETPDIAEDVRRRTAAAEGKLLGLGQMQEATPHRQEIGRDRLTAEAEYAEKAHTHLWIVIVTHKASDQVLDQHDGVSADLPILDVDTLLGPPYVGCFVCETPYEPRLRHRKCAGEPDG